MKQVRDLVVARFSRVTLIDSLYPQLCYICCVELMQVEVLLEHGVDCEKRDQDGWTALLVGHSIRLAAACSHSALHLARA